MIPDFERDVYCLLGLPFDALDIDAATRKLREAVQRRSPCFLSTPNLNFVVAAQADPAFRDSVLHSDMSVADGMPIVWAARLLGIPLVERVAGSTLFERLCTVSGEPIKVYFFGGPEGVAALACERLNARHSGMQCVGFDAPGFGTVDEMSDDERVQRIDASGAEFVVVSLGARKGQAWIERNRARLKAPLISHLGAVVNFVAETTVRAPRWMQYCGLEWLWRIKEEPSLWRRYAHDGVWCARLLVARVIPHAIYVRRYTPDAAQLAAAEIAIETDGQRTLVRMAGAWSRTNLAPLRAALAGVARGVAAVHFDLRAVTHLDAAVVALLCLLWNHCVRTRVQFVMEPISPVVRRVFHLCCAEYALEQLPGTPRSATAPAPH